MDVSDWQNQSLTIEQANLQLLKLHKFTDVTFIVGEEQEYVYAHKLILMTRSSVFQVMFERWDNSDKAIEIPEVSSAAFRIFLEVSSYSLNYSGI